MGPRATTVLRAVSGHKGWVGGPHAPRRLRAGHPTPVKRSVRVGRSASTSVHAWAVGLRRRLRLSHERRRDLDSDQPLTEGEGSGSAAIGSIRGRTMVGYANHATVPRMVFDWFDHPLSEGWLEARLRAELYRQHAPSRPVSL